MIARPVPPGPVLRLARRPATGGIQEHLPSGRCVLTPNGRSALAAALQALVPMPPARVLVPGYICSAVVDAVRASGLECSFYRVSRRLEPDLQQVEHDLAAGAEAILIVHYFGFPGAGRDEIARLAGEHGAAVIEDCAHALFSEVDGVPLGSAGRAAVFSFRKSLAVPEGGAAVFPGDEPESWSPVRWVAREGPALLREVAFRLEHELRVPVRTRVLARRAWLDRATRADRQPIDPTGGIGRISAALLERASPARLVDGRRRNFEDLMRAHAQSARRTEALYTTLPDGVSPVGFPILAPDREVLRQRLQRRGVGVRLLWDRLPGELPLDDHPDAVHLRDHILVLPVHEDVRGEHVAQVAAALGGEW